MLCAMPARSEITARRSTRCVLKGYHRQRHFTGICRKLTPQCLWAPIALMKTGVTVMLQDMSMLCFQVFVCSLVWTYEAATASDIVLHCPDSIGNGETVNVVATADTTDIALCDLSTVVSFDFQVTLPDASVHQICGQAYPGCNKTLSDDGCRCVNQSTTVLTYELAFVYNRATHKGGTLSLKPTGCFSSGSDPFSPFPCNLTERQSTSTPTPDCISGNCTNPEIIPDGTTTTTTTTTVATPPVTYVEIRIASCSRLDGPHRGVEISYWDISGWDISSSNITYYSDCCKVWVEVVIPFAYYWGLSILGASILFGVDCKRRRVIFIKKPADKNNRTTSNEPSNSNTTSDSDGTWASVDLVLFIVLIIFGGVIVYIIYAAIRRRWPFDRANVQKWQILIFIVGFMLTFVWFITYVTIAGVCGRYPLETCTCDCTETIVPPATTCTSSPDVEYCPLSYNTGEKGWEIAVFVIGILLIVAWITYGIVACSMKWWPFDLEKGKNKSDITMPEYTNYIRGDASSHPDGARASRHLNVAASAPDKQKKASKKVDSEHTHSENSGAQ